MADLTREQFLRDVRHHQMRVVRNDGLYRHLRFANPSTCNQWFELLTWPGALAMSGDMGSWLFRRELFRREQDMFGFFRTTTGEINPRYWHEKLEAIDRDGAKEFAIETLLKQAFYRIDSWDLSEQEADEVKEDLEFELSGGGHSEPEALTVLREWGYDLKEPDPSGYKRRVFFSDDLPDGLDWTHRYLWACHAIVWAIEQFDKAALGVQQRSTQILAETVPE